MLYNAVSEQIYFLNNMSIVVCTQLSSIKIATKWLIYVTIWDFEKHSPCGLSADTFLMDVFSALLLKL